MVQIQFDTGATLNIVDIPYFQILNTQQLQLPMDEIRILVDTSIARTIVLPYSTLFPVRNVKVTVMDITGNAAVNNITILAAGGTPNDAINGAASFVLNTAFQASRLEVLSTNQWATTSGGAGSGGGSSVVQITYANLIVNINSGTLTPGTWYQFDYTCVYRIQFTDTAGNGSGDDEVTGYGVTERLMIQAVSATLLDYEHVKSLDYPQDIIYWQPFDTGFLPNGVISDFNNYYVKDTRSADPLFSGVIYWRFDSVEKSGRAFDWRNFKFRRWKWIEDPALGYVMPLKSNTATPLDFEDWYGMATFGTDGYVVKSTARLTAYGLGDNIVSKARNTSFFSIVILAGSNTATYTSLSIHNQGWWIDVGDVVEFGGDGNELVGATVLSVVMNGTNGGTIQFSASATANYTGVMTTLNNTDIVQCRNTIVSGMLANTEGRFQQNNITLFLNVFGVIRITDTQMQSCLSIDCRGEMENSIGTSWSAVTTLGDIKHNTINLISGDGVYLTGSLADNTLNNLDTIGDYNGATHNVIDLIGNTGVEISDLNIKGNVSYNQMRFIRSVTDKAGLVGATSGSIENCSGNELWDTEKCILSNVVNVNILQCVVTEDIQNHNFWEARIFGATITPTVNMQSTFPTQSGVSSVDNKSHEIVIAALVSSGTAIT